MHFSFLSLLLLSAPVTLAKWVDPAEAVARIRAGRYGDAFPPSDGDVKKKERSAVQFAREDTPKIEERGTVHINEEFTIPTFSNPTAANYVVNTSALPLVTFSLPTTWAGRLPISSTSTSQEFFFWYYPCTATGGCNKLTIWLNGGPGCSSLEGAVEENGPIQFVLGGSSSPVLNQYAWTTVSDMLYIEQPIGTGFDLGTVDITGETALANEFYGFLGQFFTVFKELTAKPLYIAGESYAGFYIPYIANRILTASAAEKAALPLSLHALLINDGVYSSYVTSEQIPVANFSVVNQEVLGFSTSFVNSLVSSASSCGYTAVLNELSYPPKGKYVLPHGDSVSSSCDLFDRWYNEALNINECFNIYRITDVCPTPNDPIETYFSRSDVQSALHVPNFGSWSECSNNYPFKNGEDLSAYSETLLPSILAQIPIYLWHGLDDGILFNLGDRLTIQNLTWGGLQGFQTAPSTPLTYGGTTYGIVHSERNLTYMEIANAGHMIPQDQPVIALHVFSAVLGLTTL